MFEKLADAIINIREDEALEITQALIDKGEDPIAILDKCTEAIEEVGKRFEAGTYYLPELLMSGEMLKRISDLVKPSIKQDAVAEKKGKVLIGTVQGDIHDIGKNIVSFLLDINGFEVRDIGIDIPPADFVKAIEEFEPQVVGLSGLLTLAYDAMKETVQALSEAGLRDKVKVMIGGGQMSEKISDYVGADAYGKDAMHGVSLVKEWIGA
ncbi:MAG: cobalamin-dependent protein [Desulfosarcinaceae bacterium]